MDQPIFINGCTKAGTTLLRNLFDGHPNLFVIPSESHFFQNIHYWVNYYYRRTKPQKLSYDEMRQNLLDWIKRTNRIHDRVTDGFTKGKWNINQVKEVLFSKEPKGIKELADLYFKAIYKGLFNENLDSQMRVVEKSVENAEFAFEWKKLYPKAKFIHIIRNPYSNLVALRKYAQSSKNNVYNYPYLKFALYSMHNSYYFLYKNKSIISNYKVVRYEDIIQKSKETIMELAEWLQISYNTDLLSPRVLGENWEGNSTSGKRFKGISAEQLNNWKTIINHFEINVINKNFDFILDDFGYEKINTHRSVYFPCKWESPMKYIRNRLLLQFLPRYN